MKERVIIVMKSTDLYCIIMKNVKKLRIDAEDDDLFRVEYVDQAFSGFGALYSF